MQISSRTEQNVMIFVLEGRVDSSGALEMGESLQKAVSEGDTRLVLDMGGVSYINSAGLRTLADILTQCRANDGDLLLAALSPKVERVFKIIGFDKFFDIFDTAETAVSQF